MALTRKLLKSFGLEESVIDSIIEAHGETVDALKKQRDDALADAGKVSEVTRERDELKSKIEKLEKTGGDTAKVQAEFDAYKEQIKKEKADALNTSDVRKIGKEAGVQRESFLDLLSRVFDMSLIKRGEDGAVSNGDELKEMIKKTYPDLLGVKETGGTGRVDPPGGGNGTPSAEELGKMDMAAYIAARKNK
jgi:hypothetical protein